MFVNIHSWSPLKKVIPYALNFIPSVLNIILHHNWAKNGKVNQKSSLLKIQFVIEAIFDLCIKKWIMFFCNEKYKTIMTNMLW